MKSFKLANEKPSYDQYHITWAELIRIRLALESEFTIRSKIVGATLAATSIGLWGVLSQKSDLGKLFELALFGLFTAIFLSVFYLLGESVEYRRKRLRVQAALARISERSETLFPVIFNELGEGKSWEKLFVGITTCLGLVIFGVLSMASFVGMLCSLFEFFKF